VMMVLVTLSPPLGFLTGRLVQLFLSYELLIIRFFSEWDIVLSVTFGVESMLLLYYGILCMIVLIYRRRHEHRLYEF
jgi:hypothetical protein